MEECGAAVGVGWGNKSLMTQSWSSVISFAFSLTMHATSLVFPHRQTGVTQQVLNGSNMQNETTSPKTNPVKVTVLCLFSYNLTPLVCNIAFIFFLHHLKEFVVIYFVPELIGCFVFRGSYWAFHLVL